MKYITYKRFKNQSISGPNVNIPAFTECTCINNMIQYNNLNICIDTSYNGTEYFVQNDDGRGVYRGKLILALKKYLAQPDWHNELHLLGNKQPDKMSEEELSKLNSIMDERGKQYQAKWDKIWEDKTLHKYKRPEHTDMWLWNRDYYNAPIEDLEYICDLVGLNYRKIR